jgi:pre-mRNA-splicing helicase BRR2
VLDALTASRAKTDEIYTETKQLEARVRRETADLSRMRHAEESAAALTADPLSSMPMGARARVGRSVIDLEAIAFQQGGHLMANKKCHLPPGSFRVTKKG